MVERLLYYERDLFLSLNGSESEMLDRFMWLYSGRAVWIPLVLLLFFILVYKKGWKESLMVLVGIALVVTLCDQFASGLCKPMFERFRPTHHPDFISEVETVFNYRGGRFGFMSSHSSNAFGFATFMVYLFRHWLFSLTIYLWALVTAYSRIYLGVHFISDVVPAILFGILFGYVVYRLYKWARLKLMARSCVPTPHYTIYSRTEKRIVVSGILATVLIVLIFNVALTNLLR